MTNTTDSQTNSVTLYSANVCPFAHRTRLVLIEKGVDFSVKEIDLSNKPDWFAEVSPYGKVPVIAHGKNRVWESAVINEYLDEVYATPRLLPDDPGQRALARIWIDFANNKFIVTFYKLLFSQENEDREKWAQELRDNLLFLEKEALEKSGGPYWLGENISLVDLTFFPWFERFPVIEHYRGFSLPEECKLIKQWWQTVAQRDSVKSISNPADFYIGMYSTYASGNAPQKTKDELASK